MQIVEKTPKIFLFLMGILVLAFFVYPKLDIIITGFFWDKEQGFLFRHLSIVKFVFYYISHVSPLIGVVCFFGFVFSFFKNYKVLLKYRFSFLFLLLSLLIGPGLVTNTILKEYWGRARPADIVEFGGSKKFTRVGEISDQEGNSFVAGHPSMGFYTFSFAMLIKDRRKRSIFEALAIFLGVFVGVCRLSEGGHFLSDTLSSGLINIGIFVLLYHLIKPHLRLSR